MTTRDLRLAALAAGVMAAAAVALAVVFWLQVAPSTGPRFYATDQTALGRYQNLWLVHDHLSAHCLLVVEIVSENGTQAGGPRAVTSTPWECR